MWTRRAILRRPTHAALPGRHRVPGVVASSLSHRDLRNTVRTGVRAFFARGRLSGTAVFEGSGLFGDEETGAGSCSCGFASRRCGLRLSDRRCPRAIHSSAQTTAGPHTRTGRCRRSGLTMGVAIQRYSRVRDSIASRKSITFTATRSIPSSVSTETGRVGNSANDCTSAWRDHADDRRAGNLVARARARQRQ